MNARIDRLWPTPGEHLTDAELLADYAFPEATAWLRMNFVTSLDGAATRDGKSGSLGDDADRRLFQLLRWEADVIIVGAGTARTEGYDAMRLDTAAVEWRTSRGLAPQPTLALVSRSLDIDPASEMFTEAPTRPIIYTVAGAPPALRSELARVADVVAVGETSADPRAIRTDLARRGHVRLHAEGGPHLFGSFVGAGAVDELCLTIAPSIEAGLAPRIAASPAATPTPMRLAALFQAGSELLARYERGTT